MATIKKACKGTSYPKSSSVSSRLGSYGKKMKTGGSFPDLNKDGKITKKDVLIGRGVLPKTAKKGKMVKKAQFGKLIGKAIKVGVKKATTSAPKKITNNEISTALKMVERDRMKKMFQKIDAEEAAKPKQRMGGKTKKCMYGCK